LWLVLLIDLCCFENWIDSLYSKLGCPFLQGINLLLIHNNFIQVFAYFSNLQGICLNEFALVESICFHLIYCINIIGLCLDFSLGFTAKTFTVSESIQLRFINQNYFDYNLTNSCQYWFDSMISFSHLFVKLHFY